MGMIFYFAIALVAVVHIIRIVSTRHWTSPTSTPTKTGSAGNVSAWTTAWISLESGKICTICKSNVLF